MKRSQLAGVVAMAVRDALGRYGGQTDLQATPRHLPERGYGLQVSGLIDMDLLGEKAAEQIMAVMVRDHPEIIDPELEPQPAWDDF